MSPTLYFSFATSLSPSQEVVEECSNVLYACKRPKLSPLNQGLDSTFIQS